MSKPTIESLAGRLSELVPDRIKALGGKLPGASADASEFNSTLQGLGLPELKRDLEHNFKAVLQGAFERMELVSREEFDVQRKVLARTREKLERLEAELSHLQQGSAGETSDALSAGDAAVAEGVTKKDSSSDKPSGLPSSSSQQTTDD